MSAIASSEGSAGGPGLAQKATSAVEVMAQSVANIAPSAVMATGAALIFTSAGRGTWVSYVIGTVIVLMVGYCLAQFARRSATTGSVYSYTARGLGGFAGFMSGWGIQVGYLAIAMGSVAGAGLYFGAFLGELGIDGSGTGWQLAIFAVCTLGALLATMRGIRLSTRVGLVIELTSIALILFVVVAVLVDHGFSVDSSQLSLKGTSVNGVTFGVVLAILGFVGFESAASLGVEAKDPYRAIPRAILWSALGAGLLYVLASYTQVLGLGAGLGKSGAPLGDLASRSGIGWVNPVIDLGITASFFACAAASVNASARILYTMGREGMMGSALGRTHAEHQTPHVAIALLAPLLFAAPAAIVLAGSQALEALAYLGTIGTFGFMVAYALVSVAAPVWLARIGELRPLVMIAGPLSAAAMVYVFYKNVVPAPPSPFNVLPWVFASLMALGAAWYGAVRIAAPARVAAVGSAMSDDPAPAVAVTAG